MMMNPPTTTETPSPKKNARPKNKRRSRFERENDVVLSVTERDQNILKLLADFRFLNTDHLQLLTGAPLKKLQKRLHLLYHAGYVDRPKVQLYEWERGKGSKKMIHALGDRGASSLIASGIPRGKIDWAKKNRDVKNFSINHTLGIASFITAVKAAAPNYGYTVSRWIRGNDIKLSLLFDDENGNEGRVPLFADGFFTVETENDIFPFFLEYDTASEPVNRKGYEQSSIRRKIVAYTLLFEEERERKEGKRSTSTLFEAFGVKSFQVLFVTTTPKRIQSMRELVQTTKIPHRFCFIPESSYTLGEPHRLFEEIWTNGKDDTPRSIIKIKE